MRLLLILQFPGLGLLEGQDGSYEQDGVVGHTAEPFLVWGRWWGNILGTALGTWRVCLEVVGIGSPQWSE